MSMDALQLWREERNAALRTLDMTYARYLMPDASSDEVRLLAMHKGRYECTDIEAALRSASGEWLRERGSTRMDGSPILPAGRLPE